MALLGIKTRRALYEGMRLRDLVEWEKYWRAEPWGPWRDNLHAAIIAREVIRPHVRRGTKIKLDDFMVRDPSERVDAAKGQLVSLLRMIGTKRSAKDRRPRRKGRAKGRGARA